MNLVNPYVYSQSVAPVLDLYSGAKVAFSLRKLRTAYTGKCLRVRRSSDNTELDIDFKSNGKLDDTALLSFVGGGNGYVVKWYDQSGNALDAYQTVNANQPRIVLSGVIETQNGDNSIRLDQTLSHFMRVGLFSFTNASVFSCGYYLAGDVNSRFFAMSPVGSIDYGGSDSRRFSFSTRSILSAFRAISTGSPTGDVLINNYSSQILTSTYAEYYRRGVLIGSDYAITPSLCTAPSINIGLTGDFPATGFERDYMNGYLKELMFYDSDQSANRLSIEANISDFYGI